MPYPPHPITPRRRLVGERLQMHLDDSNSDPTRVHDAPHTAGRWGVQNRRIAHATPVWRVDTQKRRRVRMTALYCAQLKGTGSVKERWRCDKMQTV